MRAAQQSGWASTAVILPWGGWGRGEGISPQGGGVGGHDPQGRPITTSEGGAAHCCKPQNNKKIPKKKSIPKDVADRPPRGVMHPRVRITAWKWQRGDLGGEVKHEQRSPGGVEMEA